MEESVLPHPRETTTENPLWIRFQQQIQPLPLVGFGVHGVAVATVSCIPQSAPGASPGLGQGRARAQLHPPPFPAHLCIPGAAQTSIHGGFCGLSSEGNLNPPKNPNPSLGVKENPRNVEAGKGLQESKLCPMPTFVPSSEL